VVVTISKLWQRIWRLARDTEGPTAVEYAVMLSLIVVVCLSAIRTLGNNAKTTFTNVANSIGS
jgi:pilus assembly protein Flp/PilA